jgi:hypothetical protein
LAPDERRGHPGSAGSLAAGTYYYRVCAVYGTATLGYPSEPLAATVGASGSVALSWDAMDDATATGSSATRTRRA